MVVIHGLINIVLTIVDAFCLAALLIICLLAIAISLAWIEDHLL